MTFGEKLKEARKESGLSQEKFAEKMSISRSAVAKWENNNGMPDVNNLKVMSNILNVSIDYLLNDDKEISFKNIKENVSDENEAIIFTNGQKVVSCPEYEGFFVTIELCGWNDGVSDAVILFEDDTFIYYQRFDKQNSFLGMIGKKYVVSVSKGKNVNREIFKHPIDRTFFCNKHVMVEVANREGLIKGFFDFKNDDYLDVVINGFNDSKVYLKFGSEISIDSITKIEEL